MHAANRTPRRAHLPPRARRRALALIVAACATHAFASCSPAASRPSEVIGLRDDHPWLTVGHTSTLLRESVVLAREEERAPSNDVLWLRRSERPDQAWGLRGGEWPFEVGYEVRAAVSPAAHRYVVIGRTLAGELVVEAWTFSIPEGGAFWDEERGEVAVAASAFVPGSGAAPRGGAFVAPEERAAAPTVERAELFRGDVGFEVLDACCVRASAHVVLLGVDTARETSLWRFDLARPDARPVPMLAAKHRAALTGMSSIHDAALDGASTVVYEATSPAGALVDGVVRPWRYVACLEDRDGDGVIDAALRFESQDAMVAHYGSALRSDL